MSTSHRSSALAEPRARSRGAPDVPVPAGVQLPLRRGRRLAFVHLEPGTFFYLESGCLTLDLRLPDGRRQVLLVLYAGDVISPSFIPPLPDLGLTAAGHSRLVRLSAAGAGAALGQSPGIDLQEAATRLLQRTALHAMVVGRLTGEERLATLLLEMASHTGLETPGGLSFELPLSRADMADYLAINPDTLSRLMSRFKSRGLLVTPSRGRAIAKNLALLMAASPLAVVFAKQAHEAAIDLDQRSRLRPARA